MENFREKRLERQLKTQQSTSIVIGVILLLSILGNVFLFMRNSGLNNENEQLITEKNTLIHERQTIVETSTRLETEIVDLKEQISRITEGATTLESEVATRDARIATLRRQISEGDELRATEIETAGKEIERLEKEREGLLVELELINERLSGLRSQHEALTKQIEEVSYITVYNIVVNHLRDRWLGRPVSMEIGKRVNRTEIRFEIDGNIFVEPGLINVHLLMIDPNGNLVNQSDDTFSVASSGEQTPYTEYREIEYNHRPVPLDFTIIHEGLETGTYMMEVYLNGKLRGEKQFELE